VSKRKKRKSPLRDGADSITVGTFITGMQLYFYKYIREIKLYLEIDEIAKEVLLLTCMSSIA
jgi:hypothetical protein